MTVEGNRVCTNRLVAFNVPGVKEHAHFLKDVKDARMIRSRVLECGTHPFLSCTWVDD